jgi:hypothetical protein
MTTNKQIVSAIKKSLSKIDFSKTVEKCTNEAQTRQYLIEPIIQVLGYSSFDDMLTEFNAGWGAKNDRADIGLLVKDKKNPEIIVECKSLGKKLTDKEASQLNSYFINTKNSKLGILTNGMEWRFYAINNATKSSNLFEVPFLVLDFIFLDIPRKTKLITLISSDMFKTAKLLAVGFSSTFKILSII